MYPQSTILRLVTSALLLSAVPLLPLPVPASPTQAQPIPSTPLFQVEGSLEEGGTRLAEDETLYAIHEFAGEAGQVVTIVMESLEFDPYLFLIDPQGEAIAHNNDYAEGNFNSVITIELPADGVYTIVANAYDAQQKGSYTLTVLLGEEPVFSDLALRQVEARLLNQQGLQQDNTGEYQAALSSYEQALNIYQQIGDRRGEGVTLNNIGHGYDNLGEYRRALEFYEQALAILQEIGDRRGEGVTLNNIGHGYANLGEYGRALEFYEQALAILQEIGDRAGEGTTLNNIGSVYRSLGEYGAALDYHERSLTIRQEIGDRAGEGITLNNIGSVYRSLGEYGAALDYHEQALVIQQEIGDRAGEGATLNNIGSVYRSLGEYGTALDYYEQALVIQQEIGDRTGEGATLNNIGSVYDTLGEYGTALEYYEQALTIPQEIGDRAGEGATLSNIGGIYDTLGKYDIALEYYEQALTIRQEIGDRAGEGATLNNIGSVYRSLGEYGTALDYHEQALVIQQETGDRAGEGITLNNIGGIYDSLGEYGTALEYYEQALAIRQAIGDRYGTAVTLHNMGYTIESLDEPELAIVFLKASVNQWEEIRGNIRGLDVEQQQSFADSVSTSYRKLADLLLQSDRVLEAQRVLDLLKVQELDEYLQNVRGTAQTESGVELLNPEIELSQAMILGYELASLYEIPYNDRSDTQQQRINELEAQQDLIRNDFLSFIQSQDIQDLIRQLSSDVQEQDVLAHIDEFVNLQNNLRDLNQNAVLIYPLILDDRLELVVVTPFSEPTRYPIDVERSELNDAVLAFRQALTTPTSDPVPAAQTLYDWLIAPMRADLEAIGAETILYAPDGILRYVPLAALHDGDQWLTERFRVNHITAASLQNLNLRPSPQPQILAAAFSEGLYSFEVGQRDFSFAGLPFAGVEVNNLIAAFPGTTHFLNNGFTLADTERAMNSHTIVHLATHAAFVQGSPSDSFILFGNGDRLTLQYINENWEGKMNRVNLVVLSACETGVGSATLGNGEEILGFGYLMQKAGADAAIASLWSVNDGGTQVLMNAFYSALNQDMTKAEALRQAQIALISGDLTAVGYPRGNATIEFVSAETGLPPAVSNNLNHPYYWAPFILIGNGL